jgi:hypothetical protein
MSMHRSSRLWSAVLALAACGGGTEAGDTTSDTSSGGAIASTGEAVCYLGYEKCPCMDGLCLDGLVCLSDLCVQPAPETSSSEGGESSTTSAVVGDGSSDSSSTGIDASSSEESTTTVIPPECLDDDNYCDDDMLQTCVDGFWQLTTCSDWCAQTGYLSPGCDTADGCLCEGYADDTCYDGAYNICVCADIDFDIPCTDEQLQIFFDQCWTMENEFVECFSAYPIDEVADCAPAEAVCL